MELTKSEELFNTNKLRIGNLYIIRDIQNNNETVCMLSDFTYEQLTFLYPMDDTYTAVYSIHISKYKKQYEIEEFLNFNKWFKLSVQ